MSEEIRQAIHLRLEQARETLKEADALREHGLWRGVINRSYYAMFYAVLALGVSKQVVLTKHSQAIAFFDKEYVKTEIFPRELSRSLHLGFDQRQVNDYAASTGSSFRLQQVSTNHSRKSYPPVGESYPETAAKYLRLSHLWLLSHSASSYNQ
jgi:uncharacterized protein (UPF0332 family)